MNAKIDEEKKKELMRDFVYTLTQAYRNGEISYYQMRDAAGYILDFLPFVKTEKDLKSFLKGLSERWKIFERFLILSKEEEYKQKEQEVIDKLLSYIKSSQNNPQS